MTIQETISKQVLLSSIRQLIGGYPDPENPQPPGPWDPHIRRALQRVELVFGPRPEPWQWGFGHPGQPLPWVQVALNPQPLPPRAMFFSAVAQEVVDRASLIQETSEAIGSQGDRQGIIIVVGYVSRFADEFCGNGFRVKWPFPGPPPPWWVTEEISGLDLIVAGVQFELAAANTFNETVRQALAGAAAKLTNTSVDRLQ